MHPIAPNLKKKSTVILYIEDNENDFLLVQRLLAQYTKEEGTEEHFELERVDRVSKGLDRLAQGGVDLVLTDLNLPDAHELDAVMKLREHFPKVPIIALTSAYATTLGVEAVKRGAQDYLLKDVLNGRLMKLSILYAIERKRLEQMKDDFLSTVSHELRTPLSIIGGGLSLIKSKYSDAINPEMEKILKMVTRSVDHLTRIISDLLNLSRIESGRFRINRRSVDISFLIHELISDFKNELIEKNEAASVIELNIPQLPAVFVDPNLIVQVMQNLLSNARRFCKQKIIVTAQLENDMVCVSVADDGLGISSVDQEKLFQKFSQINRNEERHGYKGTGLGLALCKEIIDQHDGKIWVESTPGNGAKFCFMVHLAPKEK